MVRNVARVYSGSVRTHQIYLARRIPARYTGSQVVHVDVDVMLTFAWLWSNGSDGIGQSHNTTVTCTHITTHPYCHALKETSSQILLAI